MNTKTLRRQIADAVSQLIKEEVAKQSIGKPPFPKEKDNEVAKQSIVRPPSPKEKDNESIAEKPVKKPSLLATYLLCLWDWHTKHSDRVPIMQAVERHDFEEIAPRGQASKLWLIHSGTLRLPCIAYEEALEGVDLKLDALLKALLNNEWCNQISSREVQARLDSLSIAVRKFSRDETQFLLIDDDYYEDLRDRVAPFAAALNAKTDFSRRDLERCNINMLSVKGSRYRAWFNENAAMTDYLRNKSPVEVPPVRDASPKRQTLEPVEPLEPAPPVSHRRMMVIPRSQ